MSTTIIDRMIQYEHSDVFERYQRDYPNNTMPAKQAFFEMKKYLWLCYQHEQDKKQYPDNQNLNFSCSMYPEMHEIDDMWHTFILYTKDYADFCQRYFGKFIHHIPKTNDEDHKSVNIEIEFTRYLNYLYEKLGEQTVTLWFSCHLKSA